MGRIVGKGDVRISSDAEVFFVLGSVFEKDALCLLDDVEDVRLAVRIAVRSDADV